MALPEVGVEMLALLLVGCMNTRSYLTQTVAVSCDRAQECNKQDFESRYDDQAECREDNSEDLDDYVECYENNCEFDAKEASSCLHHMRTADCDDIYDDADCNDVFDDCDDIDLAACLADIIF